MKIMQIVSVLCGLGILVIAITSGRMPLIVACMGWVCSILYCIGHIIRDL